MTKESNNIALKNKVMTILTYFSRLFMAYVYIPHGWEKLTQKINQQEYINYGLAGDFMDFYLILERSNFIWIVGITQLIGGLLLIPRRTYLLATVWLLPVSGCMLFYHIYLSHAKDFLIFDALVLLFNLCLLFINYADLKRVFYKPKDTWI